MPRKANPELAAKKVKEQEELRTEIREHIGDREADPGLARTIANSKVILKQKKTVLAELNQKRQLAKLVIDDGGGDVEQIAWVMENLKTKTRNKEEENGEENGENGENGEEAPAEGETPAEEPEPEVTELNPSRSRRKAAQAS